MRPQKFPALGWEDPLKKEMATHFSILAWQNLATLSGYQLSSLHPHQTLATSDDLLWITAKFTQHLGPL